MNILWVGAHQDDEMKVLGTLLKYRRQGGHRFAFVCATNGDKGLSFDRGTSLEEAARIRDREMRQVAAAFEADYICLGVPDEFLFDSEPNRLAMLDAVRAARPDLIFTHWENDYNRDHIITSQLVFQAALLAPIASIRTEHAAMEHTPKIYYVHPLDEGYGYEATHYVELDQEIVEEKIRLVNCHESQVAVFRQIGDDFEARLWMEARREGARASVEYAESFRPCLASRRIPLANMLP
ncbi:MAG TPA: PIG-L family deacetylase [Chthonomonadaceae bacterium]|nr:PIG-L family deacetylase [Chthonomonadaceae bacterium]